MVGLLGVSAQELPEVIGEIYDCSLDPERWVVTCRRIADLCESTAGGIFVHDLRQVQNDQRFVFGYQPEFLNRYKQHYADSPMAVTNVFSNIGDVHALSMGYPQPPARRFFVEVLEPFGLTDILWFTALRTGAHMASMHVSRSGKMPHYQPHDFSLFRLLAPHVCRALAISNALAIGTLRSETLEKTLDGLMTGVFLVASDGHVVYMNVAAEHQIRNGNPIHLVNQRLSLTDASERAALSKAIEKASDDDAEVDLAGHSMAIHGGVNDGYLATLLPLGGKLRHGIFAPFAASVAVFIQDPVSAQPMPGEAIAQLYGLTGGELRVLMALSMGLSGMEVADMLGVSEPTVRTHLQRIFSKTHTSKQADLLGLLHRSIPPVRANPGVQHTAVK